jgi:hypothetical protein
MEEADDRAGRGDWRVRREDEDAERTAGLLDGAAPAVSFSGETVAGIGPKTVDGERSIAGRSLS